MARGGLPPTTYLTRATAPGPAHRRYHHPTARASTGRLTRRAPSPATPAPAGHLSGRQAAACQSGQRTHTHARTRAGRHLSRKRTCLMRFCAFERLAVIPVWDQCGRTPIQKFELNGVHAWFKWPAHGLIHTGARPLQRTTARSY